MTTCHKQLCISNSSIQQSHRVNGTLYINVQFESKVIFHKQCLTSSSFNRRRLNLTCKPFDVAFYEELKAVT